MSIPNPYPNIADKEINDVKTWSSTKIVNKLQPALDTEITYEETYEGNIVTFNSLNNKEISSLECEILPIQEGTGDPSPSNPRPISGTSVLNVEQTGKNLFNGINVLQMYITSTKVLANTAARLIYIECKPNTTYTISKTAGARFSAGYTTEMPASNVDVYAGIQTGVTSSQITILTGADAKYLVSYVFNSNVDTITAEEMIASCQIELGSTATTYEPYNAETYTFDLGQEIMGGTADVVGGVGTSRPYYESYNGETLVGPWICSQAVYPDTPPIGSQVVDMGGEATDFTFTGQPIESLLGVNNVWTDSGDIKVTISEIETIGSILKERGILP